MALEFSSAQRSVALLQRDDESRETQVLASAVDPVGGDLKPLQLIATALERAKVKQSAVGAVAVGLGPGSYTGIRLAIAVAQGWQLAFGIPLIGIGSIDVLAEQARRLGGRGKVCICVDAQREEFYLAVYELQDDHTELLQPLRLASREEVPRCATQSGAALIGPDILRWFPEAKLLFPDAEVLAHVAAPRPGVLEGERLEPIYLRETTFAKAPPLRVIPPV